MFVDSAAVDDPVTPPWAAGLNPAQRAAVEHDGGPLLVLAGAGTGKTGTLAARVARLVDEGTPPHRILLLTFTRRAAREMLSRVASMTDRRAAAQIWGGTFHSVGNRILRRFGASIGLSESFTVLDQSDSTDLMGMIRTDLGLGERRRRFPRKDTVAAIYSRMVSAQRPLSDTLAEAFPWCRDHAEELIAVFGAYTEAKRAQQVLDYDDLLLFWRGLLASPAAGQAVVDLFDHVLVDEYQDTNTIQADIVAGLGDGHGGLTVVGDDAQAIYGFRAATVANMWEFTTRYADATVLNLEQNYRSTPPILALANAVLAETGEHMPKRLWTDRPGTARPALITCADEGAQSEVVCDAVLDLRERGLDLRDQAVLFRTGHHSDGLEIELMRRDIPFVKYGGLKFLETAHVKDLLALLRVLDNPADQLAWHRVLGALDGVGPATLRRLHAELGLDDQPERALDRFVDGSVRFPSAAAEAVAALTAAWRDCRDGTLGPAVEVERLRPFCEQVFPARYDNPAVRLADIDQLAATARDAPSRDRFLTELTLDPAERTGDYAGPPHLDDDYLVLSTIHSAKGGEWRAVHLIHAADGNLPSEMALGDRDGLAEERRLAYVALTRARDELRITFPLRFHVNRHGLDDRHNMAPLSRFLEPHRHLCDETTHAPLSPADDPSSVTAAVDVGDEVDTMLHGLWSR